MFHLVHRIEVPILTMWLMSSTVTTPWTELILSFTYCSTIPFTIFKYAGFFQGLIYQYAIPILEQKPIIITLESPTISYIDTQDAAFFCIKSLSIKETKNKIFATGSSQAWRYDAHYKLYVKVDT